MREALESGIAQPKLMKGRVRKTFFLDLFCLLAFPFRLNSVDIFHGHLISHNEKLRVNAGDSLTRIAVGPSSNKDEGYKIKYQVERKRARKTFEFFVFLCLLPCFDRELKSE